MNLVVVPYLPLSEPVTLDERRLLPFGNLPEGGAIAPRAARRLADAYAVKDAPCPLGAVITDGYGELAWLTNSDELEVISLAVLAGAIASNGLLAADGEDRASELTSFATVENAAVYGHPIRHGADSYVTETGVLFTVVDYCMADPDEPLPPISPPVELPRPLVPSFDSEIANAVMTVLKRADDDARRLSRLLRWFTVILSNAHVVTSDVRVGAAQAAFEVLLEIDDHEKSKRLTREYGRFLAREEPETTRYTKEEIIWSKGDVELTDDEFWMTRLCMLRNRLLHGAEVPVDLWEFRGHSQVAHIHDRLLEALRLFTARAANDEALALRVGDRSWERAVEAAHRVLTTDDQEDP